MSFPTFASYEFTGVEWFPRIPSTWKVAKLGRLLMDLPCYGVLVPDFEPDGVPMLRITDMDNGNADRESLNKISRSLSNQYSRTLVKAGDVVISVVGTIGVAFVIKENLSGVNLSRAVARIQVTGELSAEYLCWVFRSMQFERYVDLTCTGTAQRVLNMKDLSAFIIPRPPLSEQRTIASFLDRETAKIDTLIAEQQRLIELLLEKRQAVISHAVTKGLNPDAPMKDSGIEWLGEVPTHWEVGPVKHFFTSLDGRRIPLSTEERSHRQGEFPYYGASGIIDYVDDFLFDENLVLVSEDGANLVNRATPIAFVATGKYWVNNHAHILKPNDGNLNYWAERIEAVDLAPFVSGSAQPKFTAEALMNLRIAVPPTAEERASIQKYFLNSICGVDALINEAKRATSLLQERRSALISAAVTGQIDVRGLAPREAA